MNYRKRLENIDKKIFLKYKKYILTGKILKVGTGIGYANKLIQDQNNSIVHLDVKKHADSLVETQIYGGNILPFSDNSFDVVLCLYTLHHAKNSRKLLQELQRVCKTTLILYETTYNSFFSKCSLIFYDWRANFLSAQPVAIRPKSYFVKEELRRLLNGKFLAYEITPRRGYFKEFIVMKK